MIHYKVYIRLVYSFSLPIFLFFCYWPFIILFWWFPSRRRRHHFPTNSPSFYFLPYHRSSSIPIFVFLQCLLRSTSSAILQSNCEILIRPNATTATPAALSSLFLKKKYSYNIRQTGILARPALLVFCPFFASFPAQLFFFEVAPAFSTWTLIYKSRKRNLPNRHCVDESFFSTTPVLFFRIFSIPDPDGKFFSKKEINEGRRRRRRYHQTRRDEFPVSFSAILTRFLIDDEKSQTLRSEMIIKKISKKMKRWKIIKKKKKKEDHQLPGENENDDHFSVARVLRAGRKKRASYNNLLLLGRERERGELVCGWEGAAGRASARLLCPFIPPATTIATIPSHILRLFFLVSCVRALKQHLDWGWSAARRIVWSINPAERRS